MPDITPAPYSDENDPQWHVADFTDVPIAVRSALYNDLKDLLALFPQPFRDCEIEIVGSFALGGPHKRSDLDVNFASKDGTDFCEKNWRGYAKCQYPWRFDIWRALYALTNKYKISIKIGFGPSAKRLICFDMDRDIWHGKFSGQIVPKKARYNIHTKQIELIDRARRITDY